MLVVRLEAEESEMETALQKELDPERRPQSTVEVELGGLSDSLLSLSSPRMKNAWTSIKLTSLLCSICPVT